MGFKNISFAGFRKTKKIVDRQNGPECWLEAMENLIQLYIGDKSGASNQSTEKKLREILANNKARYGYYTYIDEEGQLADNVSSAESYKTLLDDVGIPVSWYPFSHATLVKALALDRCVLLRVKAFVYYYPGRSIQSYVNDKSHHAIVVSDSAIVNGVEGYYILDSNLTDELFLPKDVLELAAVTHPAANVNMSMLITDGPAKWNNV